MEYRLIKAHPNYCVSSDGRVFRLRKDELREIRPETSNGYSRVCLDGKNCQIARLVAELYCEQFDPDANYIFHINGDKSDNRSDNLCWMTMSEIQQWSTYTIPYRIANLPLGVR